MGPSQQAYNLSQQFFNDFDMSGEGNGTAIPDGQYEAPFQYYLNNQVLDQSTNFSNSIPTFTNNELPDTNHTDGYSNSLNGGLMQSPIIHNFNQVTRHLQSQPSIGNSSQPLGSYSGWPVPETDIDQWPRFTRVMQGGKNANTRSLTLETPQMSTVYIGSPNHLEAGPPQMSLSSKWDHIPTSLLPIQNMYPNLTYSDVLEETSIPIKSESGHQAGSAIMLQPQELRRRNHCESHNLVERRRRDRINGCIQELGQLVPIDRLEDEKAYKSVQKKLPLSLSVAEILAPPRGLGDRRTSTSNITTGTSNEEHDKYPNKSDVLKAAVGWTRDLMWMLHLKIQQQKDLANIIVELGGKFPFEETEDEKRMQSELTAAMATNDGLSHRFDLDTAHQWPQ